MAPVQKQRTWARGVLARFQRGGLLALPDVRPHWYKQRIDRKVAGYGCSLCSSRKLVLRVNDLATTDPLLVMEFHPTLNGAKKPELMFAGNESYYWKCLAAGHVRKQNVPNRRKSRGCTDCERGDRILA